MNLYQDQTGSRISQRTVVAQVMNRLKDEIASGEYRPGDKLPTEQELAKRFGVGRSSIREAIKVFQHLGVVESRAAKGTFLRDRANISSEAITWALILGEDDLRDVVELREAVEGICFRRLAEAVEQGEEEALATLSALQEQVDVMSEAARERAVERLVEADYRFHGLIVSAGKNELFRALYSSLHAFMSEEISTTYEQMTALADAARDHAEITRDLREGPADRACQRHAQHFQRTRRLLKLASSG